jgi:hypothetical protein
MVIGSGVQPTRVVYLMLHCNADQACDNRHDAPFSSCACRWAHFAHPDRCLDLGCQDVGIGSISRLMRPRIPRPAGVSVSSGLESQLLNRIPNVITVSVTDGRMAGKVMPPTATIGLLSPPLMLSIRLAEPRAHLARG